MINFKPVTGFRDKIVLLDQTRLPTQEISVMITNLYDLEDAIKKLVVRGAPAIGIAAAYGVCMHIEKGNTKEKIVSLCQEAYDVLLKTRPTAVNLCWALNRMRELFIKLSNRNENISDIKEKMFGEATKIEQEDYEMCRKIGDFGFSLIKDQNKVTALTLCNAGGLATSGYGTALAPFYIAKEKGIDIEVYALETRPLLQGSRLTAYELLKAGIKTTLLTDNMAGSLMQNIKIDLIITGADRIASNGDTANKIGTYQLSILAKYHNIPFYVAAPVSTLDTSLKKGSEIPIEFRGREEIINFSGVQTAPKDVNIYAPAFDITPSHLISGIITNEGIFYPPYHFNKTLG